MRISYKQLFPLYFNKKNKACAKGSKFELIPKTQLVKKKKKKGKNLFTIIAQS